MATASFPVTFPTATSWVGTQTLSEVAHADDGHNKDRAEIIATQQKVGLGSSFASAGVALLGTGGTQSAWGSITNNHISGTAGIGVTKLATGAALQVLRTNSGATAVEWGYITGSMVTGETLTNAHISASGSIAVSKLAPGSNKTVLTSNGTTNSFSGSPTLSGTLTVEGGINVGSGAGATAGEIVTSSHVKAGGALYPSGQTSQSYRVGVQNIAGSGGTFDIVGQVFALIYLADGNSGQVALIICQGGISTVVQVYSSSGATFNINSDAGTDLAIFYNAGTSSYRIKNRNASARNVTYQIWGG